MGMRGLAWKITSGEAFLAESGRSSRARPYSDVLSLGAPTAQIPSEPDTQPASKYLSW